MVTITAKTPQDLEFIEVVALGDAHDGDKFFDEKAFLGGVAYIEESPHRYCILNGDMLNIALKNSKSDVYSDQRTPLDQIKHMARLLRPIKNKILGITGGNHEFRITQDTTIDVAELLAVELGLIDRYSAEPYILFVSVGISEKRNTRSNKQFVYSFYCHHGFGGGKKAGSKLNNVVALNEIVDADIYVMSHLHTPASTKSDFFRLDYQNKACAPVTRGYLLANAWMKYGGYAHRKGYSPATITISRARLSGRGKKHFEITI